MVEFKEGKITSVSKFGGIRLNREEQWYNPIKPYQKEVTDKLLNAIAKLRMTDETHFDNIAVVGCAQPSENQSTGMTKDDYWSRKEERDIRRNQEYAAGANFNTAIKIVQVAIANQSKERTPENILIAAELIAPKVKEAMNKLIELGEVKESKPVQQEEQSPGNNNPTGAI